jgi:hypothetical protein
MRSPIFEKIDHEAVPADHVQCLRIDGKTTGSMGDESRGGLTRSDHQACEHDWGLHE